MTNFIRLMRKPENRDLRNGMVAAVVALLVIGGLALSLIVSHQSERTANKAIGCLDQVLADRATTTVSDNKAQIAAAAAAKNDAVSFQVLLQDLLTNAPQAKEDTDFLAYIKIHEMLVTTETNTATTLANDQAIRDAHPLGKC